MTHSEFRHNWYQLTKDVECADAEGNSYTFPKGTLVYCQDSDEAPDAYQDRISLELMIARTKRVYWAEFFDESVAREFLRDVTDGREL